MEKKERDTKRTRIGMAGGLTIFYKEIANVRKDHEKRENMKKSCLQKYELESCSQNSDSSKETSNETSAVNKNHLVPSQEKALSPNKLHNYHTKQNSHSRQSINKNHQASDIQESKYSKHHNSSNNSSHYKVNAGHDHTKQNSRSRSSIDQNQQTSDVQESRQSKHHNSFNNSSQCNMNAGQDYFEKSVKSIRQKSSNSFQEKFLASNKTSKDLVTSSNSRPSICQNNNSQTQVHGNHSRANAHDEHRLNTGHNCHKNTSKSIYINGDSLVDSSNVETFKHYSNSKYSDSITVSPKNFDVDKISDQELQYKGCIKISQYDSYRDNFSKGNRNYDSDQRFKHQKDKLEADCKAQSTKIQNDIERNSSTSDNDNYQVIIVDTDVKHQRISTESNETIKNCKEKNIKITCNFSVNDLESDSVLKSSDSNEPVSPISNASPANLPVSALETSSYKAMFSYPDPADNIKTLFSSSDSIIPPPVACDSANFSENMCSNAEKSLTSSQMNRSEDSYADEAYFSLPDSEHLEAISNFITKIVEKRSAPASVALTVVCDLNRFFKNNFEGNVIDYYGSYYSGLAITTSDINLMVQADVSMRKSFMSEIHKNLSRELERYHVYGFEEAETIYKSKINFTHPDTGINCELAYLGRRKENFLKMGQFFKQMCNKDKRTKQLIIAAKVWAEHFNINEVEDGKLHPVGFALLVIHYLQHCENPLLPIYSIEEKGMKSLSYNDATVGALWLGFLRYYAFTFNWQEDILTVTSIDRVSKESKKWENYWIAIEDPFTEKNIALTVENKDVADYIKCCFEKTYDYFFNGPKFIPSFGDEENESSNESNNSQLEFSFNDCIVELDEVICELCDEIGDVCDECKKKIYVQPDIACVPKMTDEFLKIVKKALEAIYGKYMLSQDEISDRKQFVKKLEGDVCKIYTDAKLRLFGSSANGFGFKKSDLDICMTFKSKKQFKAVAVLKDLRNLLRRDKNFVSVIAIFNANIPILKFRYEPKGWRGDISLDNVLAVHNSELLYTYSLMDERCKILGCALKLLAKKALIAEVTEKALSSYSYLIMVIHFLQQTNPPVLPILQDNKYRKDYELDDIIDNCNIWFCRDIKHIKKTFKTENNIPVEQLFLDLLDYYCFFDCNQVINIRQMEKLTLCEKMRAASLFQIQDPFIVTKNLGCVVSPSKARETKSILNRARILFRTPKKEIPNNDLENYFFSTMSLTGRIQKEALCDFCGKFGHDQNDCKQSSPQKNFFLKYGPRKYQYANRNDIFKRQQMNRHRFTKRF